MAKKIDKVNIVAGRLVTVKNTKRPKFTNAKTEYKAVWVEDANGRNERCLLFTDREIAAAEHRSDRNKEDLTDKDFLANLFD